MKLFSKAFLSVTTLLGVLLYTSAPQVFAHDDERRGRFQNWSYEAHRDGHRDLRDLHSEFHEYPPSRREHRRFHHKLKKEHRRQHRVLSDWQNDYDRNRSWDWRTNDDDWGRWSRNGWRRGYDDYDRYDRSWRYGRN